MAGELSGILEHVDRISELDLDGVEPTSHVIALENVLRPDRPRPSWSRDEVLERAPDPASGSFRVPSRRRSAGAVSVAYVMMARTEAAAVA